MEFVDQEATAFGIKIKNDVMRRLVEVVVVDRLRLIHENLFTICIHGSHDGLVFGRQIMAAKILVFHIEYLRTRSSRGIAFSFKFKDGHSIIITSSKIVK